MMEPPLEVLGSLLAAAKSAGAEAADALLVKTTSLSLERRLGAIQHFERSEAAEAGLRVFVAGRTAIVSTGRIDPHDFPAIAERAIAMARTLPADPHARLAEPSPPPDAGPLELVDPLEPDPAALTALAGDAEDAALAVPGVTNSEGAEAGWTRSEVALATSAGFRGEYARTSHAISVVAVAGTGTAMQRDYDFSTVVHRADLEDAASLGAEAGRRAVARLNPTRPSTRRLPIIYDARVAGSLLGHLAAAINGGAVARGTSFLKDRMGQPIFAAGIAVHDDPRRPRGLRSRPFDGEGLATSARALVSDGRLESWLLDLASAHQLGLTSTAHARRGPSAPPEPGASNLYLAAGTLSPHALMADIGEGLLVTELIGHGINPVTGDYSRGAAGFMIRHGEVAEPVAEITIAGNLSDMFAHLVPANDLRFRRGTDAPTVRIDGMTMGGA